MRPLTPGQYAALQVSDGREISYALDDAELAEMCAQGWLAVSPEVDEDDGVYRYYAVLEAGRLAARVHAAFLQSL